MYMHKNMYLIIFLFVFVIVIYYFLFLRSLYSSDYFISGNNHLNVDKLMIIAHPDDELIFGGKELIKEKGWKVVCVTNGSNRAGNIFSFCPAEKRIKEFISVMNKLECRYEILDYEDNGFNANWNEISMLNKIRQLIDEKKYKKILTHNLNGEYGHVQHKKISEIVHRLKPNNLYVFDIDYTKTNSLKNELNKLLLLYNSQNKIIVKHRDYVDHQSCTWVDHQSNKS